VAAEEWVIIAGAVLAGLALGILAVLPLHARRRRARQRITTEVVAQAYEILGEDDETPLAPPTPPPAPATDDDEPYTIARDPLAPAPPSPRASPAPHPYPPTPPPPEDAIPSEWARRLTGPLHPDRARGICSGCGTKLSVSKRRPIRIACPVCGRTRLLT
jgi:hypothetical protein